MFRTVVIYCVNVVVNSPVKYSKQWWFIMLFILCRHREVCKKSPEDICAKTDNLGEVKFYKTLPSSRLSR